MESATAWKPRDSTSDSPTSRTASTSNVSYNPCNHSLITPVTPTHIITAALDQEVQSEREVMLLPEHMDELLTQEVPWCCC